MLQLIDLNSRCLGMDDVGYDQAPSLRVDYVRQTPSGHRIDPPRAYNMQHGTYNPPQVVALILIVSVITPMTTEQAHAQR